MSSGSSREALGLQVEIARTVARTVRTRIGPEEETRVARWQATDPETQAAYLKGLFHLRLQATMLAEPTPQIHETLLTAIRHLEEATTLDPEWPPAHGALAEAYHSLASRFGREYEDEYFPRAKAAALRALSLDESESRAHATRGSVLYQFEWDWEGAERAIRRALERGPLSEVLKHRLALAYTCAGRPDEATVHLRELQERVEGQERPDQLAWLGHSLARAHARMGRDEEAIAVLEDIVVRSDSLGLAVMGLVEAYARAGRTDDARALLARLEEQAGGPLGYPAQVLAALGDTERAAAMVDELFRSGRRSGWAAFRCTETYRLLRDHPSVQAIVERVGYPS